MDKRDVIGMITYMLLSVSFGGGVGILALIVKENADRCCYYSGRWNKGDLVRGCIAIGVGMVLNRLIFDRIIW